MSESKAGALSGSTGLEIPLVSKVPQAAKLLGLHVSSIDRLIALGELKPIIKLRHRLIPRSEIERFLNSRGDDQDNKPKTPRKGGDK